MKFQLQSLSAQTTPAGPRYSATFNMVLPAGATEGGFGRSSLTLSDLSPDQAAEYVAKPEREFADVTNSRAVTP